MNIYSIKVAIRGVSPMIWRRLRIAGDTSLADLHHILQIAMGWDNDYLHCFHIYGKDYGISYEGGLSFSDDHLQVRFDDLAFFHMSPPSRSPA
ncbi:MAG: plasmid pRiA4b ORF-3 family protein [Amphritea sp.]